MNNIDLFNTTYQSEETSLYWKQDSTPVKHAIILLAYPLAHVIETSSYMTLVHIFHKKTMMVLSNIQFLVLKIKLEYDADGISHTNTPDIFFKLLCGVIMFDCMVHMMELFNRKLHIS